MPTLRQHVEAQLARHPDAAFIRAPSDLTHQTLIGQQWMRTNRQSMHTHWLTVMALSSTFIVLIWLLRATVASTFATVPCYIGLLSLCAYYAPRLSPDLRWRPRRDLQRALPHLLTLALIGGTIQFLSFSISADLAHGIVARGLAPADMERALGSLIAWAPQLVLASAIILSPAIILTLPVTSFSAMRLTWLIGLRYAAALRAWGTGILQVCIGALAVGIIAMLTTVIPPPLGLILMLLALLAVGLALVLACSIPVFIAISAAHIVDEVSVRH